MGKPTEPQTNRPQATKQNKTMHQIERRRNVQGLTSRLQITYLAVLQIQTLWQRRVQTPWLWRGLYPLRRAKVLDSRNWTQAACHLYSGRGHLRNREVQVTGSTISVGFPALRSTFFRSALPFLPFPDHISIKNNRHRFTHLACCCRTLPRWERPAACTLFEVSTLIAAAFLCTYIKDKWKGPSHRQDPNSGQEQVNRSDSLLKDSWHFAQLIGRILLIYLIHLLLLGTQALGRHVHD